MNLEESLKKEILRKFLTKEALERLGRVRLVKPELVKQLEVLLLKLYKSGKLKETIDDEKLKVLLKSLSTKKEFRLKL